MTVARSQLVDVYVTPWYHVISKTVRGAWLLGQGQEDRKQWIEDRLEELSRVFAIESVLEGLLLGSYRQLVDWTSRLVRKGKARVSAQVASILDRLGANADVWQATLEKLFSRSNELGVAFAFHRQRLKEAAARRGCHHVANLNGCPA